MPIPRPAEPGRGKPRQDGGAQARDAEDREAIRLARDRSEPAAGTAGSRIAVRQRPVEIRHAATLVEREQLQPVAVRVGESVRHEICPPPPCLIRLVASSVDDERHPSDARLSQPDLLARVRLPCGELRADLARDRVDLARTSYVHRASITVVPCPGADSISNSLHSRFAPLSPRPSPLPVV